MTCSHAPSRLLLVDDEASYRELLAEVLREEGHEVTVAADGAEAVAAMRLLPPDLLLLDLMMPTMTGAEVVVAMAGDPHLASIPVLLVSGSDPGEALRSGANVVGCVRKPVRLDALLQKIATILG